MLLCEQPRPRKSLRRFTDSLQHTPHRMPPSQARRPVGPKFCTTALIRQPEASIVTPSRFISDSNVVPASSTKVTSRRSTWHGVVLPGFAWSQHCRSSSTQGPTNRPERRKVVPDVLFDTVIFSMVVSTSARRNSHGLTSCGRHTPAWWSPRAEPSPVHPAISRSLHPATTCRHR